MDRIMLLDAYSAEKKSSASEDRGFWRQVRLFGSPVTSQEFLIIKKTSRARSETFFNFLSRQSRPFCNKTLISLKTNYSHSKSQNASRGERKN
jgi:hypothetical protein